MKLKFSPFEPKYMGYSLINIDFAVDLKFYILK